MVGCCRPACRHHPVMHQPIILGICELGGCLSRTTCVNQGISILIAPSITEPFGTSWEPASYLSNTISAGWLGQQLSLCVSSFKLPWLSNSHGKAMCKALSAVKSWWHHYMHICVPDAGEGYTHTYHSQTLLSRRIQSHARDMSHKVKQRWGRELIREELMGQPSVREGFLLLREKKKPVETEYVCTV